MSRYLIAIALVSAVALSCAHGPRDQAGSLDPAVAEVGLEVGALRPLPERASGLVVDGDLSDWPGLPFEVEDSGSEGRASFGLSRDESMLCLGVWVEDDRIVTADGDARVWHHDYLELRIDPRPFEQRTLIRTQWDLRTVVFLALFPVLEEGSDQVWRRDNYPEELGVGQRSFEGGYVMSSDLQAPSSGTT